MRTGVALAFVTYVMAMSQALGLFTALLQAVIDLLGTALILWLALYFTNRLSRMQQAFGGLCGASAYINLASLPIVMLRQSSAEVSSVGLVDFVMLVWALSLLAYIIRHTFEIKMVASIFIAYLYVMIWSSIINAVVPAPVRETLAQNSNLFLDSSISELLTGGYATSFESQIVIEVVALSATVL